MTHTASPRVNTGERTHWLLVLLIVLLLLMQVTIPETMALPSNTPGLLWRWEITLRQDVDLTHYKLNTPLVVAVLGTAKKCRNRSDRAQFISAPGVYFPIGSKLFFRVTRFLPETPKRLRELAELRLDRVTTPDGMTYECGQTTEWAFVHTKKWTGLKKDLDIFFAGPENNASLNKAMKSTTHFEYFDLMWKNR